MMPKPVTAHSITSSAGRGAIAPTSLSSCHEERLVCERGGHASEPRPGSSEGFIGDATTYTIQFCCSDPTFQSSALVWVGCAVVNPGGVNFETTSWICLPPPLITNAICITPWGKGVLGTFKLITALPVQSELTV